MSTTGREPSDDDKGEWSTIRVRARHARQLSKLAALRESGTAADIYGELLAPVVDAAVREEMSRQLRSGDKGAARRAAKSAPKSEG